jgi:hypothetical protein
MAPKKLEKKLRKEEKVKKAIIIEKKKEIVQKYESGVRVTDLANTYSMSKSTILTITHIIQPFFIMKRLGRGALGGSECIMGISIISYGKNSLDLRPTRVTTSPRERIEFVSQGSTVVVEQVMQRNGLPEDGVTNNDTCRRELVVNIYVFNTLCAFS